ncbi:MAG TPA: spore coat protein CotH [Mogibacterium sp.]|nr:spore coat protein CotH [Mogibacterium sp.]
MLKHKYIDRICIIVMVAAVALTILFMNGKSLGIIPASSAPGYETRLFNKTKVHTVDIIIDDWNAFLEKATDEEYSPCTLVIDGEKFSNIGIRAKGNNSLRLTEKYGLDRYSLKIEFDHYAFNSYYGLDKFSLDSSFQDNSYMKTWITFDMMEHMDVPTPLCSYTWVRVNGEDWGLFLAIEEPEEAFAKRNFGPNYGKLYKPDYKWLDEENADVHLRYTDDDFDSYDNIFRKSKFDITDTDKQRLIDSLKVLSTGENLETAINVDEVLRYFTVQVFVVNMDSYLGKTGHNYFLHEKDGILSIIPWDYNLAFGTYSLGMPNPINDSTLYVNYPINTPASGEVMRKRPLYHNLMKNREYYDLYHEYFDYLVESYFENGYFENFIEETREMIAPYVKKDPTAFCSYKDFNIGVDTIKRFSLLRAESVRGQLDGRIPSTIAGQAKDKSNFVDASSVWLPDMGEIADLKNNRKNK